MAAECEGQKEADLTLVMSANDPKRAISSFSSAPQSGLSERRGIGAESTQFSSRPDSDGDQEREQEVANFARPARAELTPSRVARRPADAVATSARSSSRRRRNFGDTAATKNLVAREGVLMV